MSLSTIKESCDKCALVELKPGARKHYWATGDAGSYPEDCQCSMGNDEFPNGDGCIDFIPDKCLGD